MDIEEEIKKESEKFSDLCTGSYESTAWAERGFIAGAKWILKQAYSKGTLSDWYQASIDNTIPPIWTDKHIDELFGDFYCIRK